MIIAGGCYVDDVHWLSAIMKREEEMKMKLK